MEEQVAHQNSSIFEVGAYNNFQLWSMLGIYA
jgi:hypothetical protein